MWLARQIDGGPLQAWEVDQACVSFPEAGRGDPKIRTHKPRTWRFGEPCRYENGEPYPMLVKPGSAALGRTMVEALDLLAGE